MTDDTITVTITVTGENDSPEVTGQSSVDYAENGAADVATYTADDPEGTSITWSLSGNDSGDFSISNGGVLTFSTSPDYEDPADADTDNEYLVTVRASDGDNIVTLAVTVTVTDENEPPAFAAETGTRAIAENTEAGQPIGDPVEAEDPDAGDSLTYTLSGADAASFDIVTTSGQLQTKTALDHETKPSYEVTVSVRDGKDGSGNADMATDATISRNHHCHQRERTAGVPVHRDRRSQRGREHPCQPGHRPSCVGHRSGRRRHHADLHAGRR